jgi:hypothetical protein
MGFTNGNVPSSPSHRLMFYVIVHGIPVLATTGLMSLMTWIMSTITQNQLTGGDDATGNLPGFVFLYVSDFFLDYFIPFYT